MSRKLIAGLVVLIFFAQLTPAFAGRITGVLVYRSGAKASGFKVQGLTSDGATKATRSDSKGKFTLTWSSNKTLLKVYVNGTTKATNVKDGSNIEIVVD